MTTEPQEVPSPGGLPTKSMLSHLADRHRQIAEEQVLRKRVPRWSDPELWVRYRPVSFDAVDRARVETERLGIKPGDSRSSEILFHAQLDALIEGCDGVYARLPDVDPDQEFSLVPGKPEAPLTRFDDELAVALGLDRQSTARQVVRSVFFTDGDIIQHANELAQWSGYSALEADRRLGES